MIDFVKVQEIDGIDEYIIPKPHPPEIPAFEREPLKFYVSEPAGGVNADTIPLLAMPGHKVLAGMTPYLRSLHRSISTKKNVLVITVEFLGIKTIRGGSGVFTFDEFCLMQTNLNLRDRGLPQMPDSILKAPDMMEQFTEFLKRLPPTANSPETPLALLVTRHENDHYDFGLIQVIDCLWAIRILKNQYPHINWSALTAAGVSHGGYMACQCAKLAPNTFALGINAYGWTEPHLPWILKEEWLHPIEHDGLHLVCMVDNYWSANPEHPFFMSPARRLVRSQNDLDQVLQWRRQQHTNLPHFVLTQQVDDEIHSRQSKIQLASKMREAGFSLEYLDSLDEPLKAKYRSLAQSDHISFKGLIYDFMTPDRLPTDRKLISDFERKSLITYRCADKEYQVDFTPEFPLLKVSAIQAENKARDATKPHISTDDADKKHSPGLKLFQGHLFMEGVTSEAIELWDTHNRQIQARENVATALGNQETPIFIGIEHLPKLMESWPANRVAVLIEKSEEYREIFKRDFCPTSPPPENIILVTGQTGIKPPFTFKSLDYSFYHQEVGALIFRMMSLPDALFQNHRIYSVPSDEPADTIYNHYLHRALYSLAESKKFHTLHQARYDRFRNSSDRGNKPLFIPLMHSDMLDFGHHFDALQPCDNPLVFSMEPMIDPAAALGGAFDKRVLDHPASAHEFLHDVRPFGERTLAMLMLIEHSRPARALIRNRSPFYTLEDTLFTEEALRRLGIETCFFFLDSFYEHTEVFDGGWAFQIYSTLWPREQTCFFTSDAVSNANSLPARHPTYFAPHRNIAIDYPITPPLENPADLSGEIVAIHAVRNYSTFFNEINEMVEVLQTFCPLEIGAASYNSLFLLKQYPRLLKAPFTSFYFQHFIQMLHWFFNAQSRIRRMMQALEAIGHLNFKIYGEGWNQYIPAQYCKGQAHATEIPSIHRGALCTIDFAVSPNPGLPHFAAIQCLANGGLPIISAPFLGSPDTSSADQHVHAALPMFHNTQELADILGNLTQNMSTRADRIRQAQEELKASLGKQTAWAASIENLVQKGAITRPKTPFKGELTGSPSKDRWILEVFTGYLYSFGGYLACALDVWAPLIMEGECHHLPLIYRAVQTALEANDRKKAKQFLAQATPLTEEEKKTYESLSKALFG